MLQRSLVTILQYRIKQAILWSNKKVLLPASIKNLNSFVLNEAVTDSLAVVLKKYLLNSYSDKNVFSSYV